MAEEIRFFLRTALYSGVISVIYWFASYEPATGSYDWAGTVMLAFTALAAGGVAAVLAGSVSRARASGGGGPLTRVGNVIGLGDPIGAADDRPLSTELDPVPTGSAWPVAGGLAALLIGTGLVFGAWLWLPGIALLAATTWGWITERG